MKRPIVWGVLMLLSALPAFAGPRDDVYAGSARCADIADDRTWLDCFYGSAQPMRTRLGLPPAPASQTQLVPASGHAYVPPADAQAPPVAGRPPMPEASSGFGHLFGGKPLVSNIRMASYSFDANGFFTVTLEDGEIWQESSSWPTLAKWKLPPASYYVSILPGLLGSYDLKVRGMNGYFKVHRLH
jgi:hypothetical protein